MWKKQVNGMGNGVGKMNICSLVLSVLLIVMLVSVVSAEENNSISFVLGTDHNRDPLENIITSGYLDINISFYNATEANSTNFSAENVIFLSSLDAGTLQNLNNTLNHSAHIVSYDLPETHDYGNVNDSNITGLWEAGGYHNVKTLIRYMNDSFYGSGVPASEKLEVAFVFSRDSSIITMNNVASDPAVSDMMNISTYFGRSNEDLSFDLSDKDIVVMRDLAAPVIETITPTVNAAKANGAHVISVGDLVQSYSLHNVNLSDLEYSDINEYFKYDSEENFKRLTTFLSVKFAGRIDVIQPTVERPIYGIYHPEAGEIYSNAEDYLDWYSTKGYDHEKPTVAVIYSSLKHIYGRDAPLAGALVDSFESRNCNVIVASYSYKDPASVNYLMLNGEPIIDSVIIVSRGGRMNYKDSEQGIEDLKTWNVTPLNGIRLFYGVSAEEWENSSHGVGPEQTFQLAAAEMDGIIEPIVIGCKDPSIGDSAYYPIDYQVEWLTQRTISWMQLHRMLNSEKKIVIPYYAAEAGKASMGADIDYYLDAQASLANLLKAMKARGYDLGTKPLPDRDELAQLMVTQGYNIGTWAPGELEKRMEKGSVILIHESQYLEWFNGLSQEKQEEMINIWGEPPGEIMVYENETGKYLVIPKIEFGNVILAPDPMWGWDQNETVMYHDGSIPPTHQNLAFYLYLGKVYDADALFPIFTSIMAMPGKEAGLSAQDWGAILLQDMPIVHVLPMDAEGIFDRRRANMLIVDFMTPTIVPSGLYGNLSILQQDIGMYRQVVDEGVKVQYRSDIINLTRELDLDKDMEVNLEDIEGNVTATDAFIDDLDDYLQELKTTFMPYGSHTLSEPPTGESLVAMVESMLGKEFKQHVQLTNSTKGLTTALLNETVLNGTSAVNAQNMILGGVSENITADLNLSIEYTTRINGCTIEIPRILDALEGKYIPPGPAGDPIRNPDALPTGRNLCTFDDRLIPTTAAWKVGTDLADKLIALRLAENGTYPRKVAFLLWSIETTRHQGTMESEIFYLLGVKPVWDSKGRVNNVELINSSELGRSRIDVVVTTSGSYRDMYGSRLQLIDKAVRLASEADGDLYPNYVKQNSNSIYQSLIDVDYDNETAYNLSVSRIFCPPPGSYTPGIEHVISSDTWEERKKIADLYIDRMGYIYGQEMWGEQYTDVFRQNLADVEVGVFSRTSNLYGTLEHPMVAAYFGGLSLAVESVTGGNTPDMYINNQRDIDCAKIETLNHFLSKDLRSRYLNPTWIEGMKEHGYDGTRYMDAFIGNMGLWDTVMPDLITDSMWDEVYETYVLDQYNIGVSDYLKETNPYAYQSMTANMLNSIHRSDWHVSDDVVRNLVKEYVESVVEEGVTCCHHTCGNPTLNEYIEGMMSVAGLSAEDIEKYRHLMDEATGRQTEQSTTETVVDGSSSSSTWRRFQSSRSGNESTDAGSGAGMDTELKPEAGAGGEGASNPSDYVEGYEMQDESAQPSDAGPMSFSGADFLGMLIVVLAAGAIYIGFRRRGG